MSDERVKHLTTEVKITLAVQVLFVSVPLNGSPWPSQVVNEFNHIERIGVADFTINSLPIVEFQPFGITFAQTEDSCTWSASNTGGDFGRVSDYETSFTGLEMEMFLRGSNPPN